MHWRTTLLGPLSLTTWLLGCTPGTLTTLSEQDQAAQAADSASLSVPDAPPPNAVADPCTAKVAPPPDPDPPPVVDTAGDGNAVVGPKFTDAPEMAANAGVPHGTIAQFSMNSADSNLYRGLTGRYTRNVWLYKPPGYRDNTAAPFMVVQDGGAYTNLFAALDNLIAAQKVPPMLALLLDSGGGDGRGSQRGLEYDTVSDTYYRFIETEVLPRVSREHRVTFTSNPEGRATMGGSSGGACAFTMAWFHPESYRRVLTYSGTFVNQAPDKTYPHSAWEYHDHLIAEAPRKPLRIFLEVGSMDNNQDAGAGDGMHNWMVANERMAQALAAKGYHYQYIYAQGGGHVDGRVLRQTLPQALVWLWRGYQP